MPFCCDSSFNVQWRGSLANDESKLSVFAVVPFSIFFKLFKLIIMKLSFCY